MLIGSTYLAMKKPRQIEIRDITQDEVMLERFLDMGAEIDGVRYPTRYVREQSKCFALLNNGRLLGGYIMVVEGPFRTIHICQESGRNPELVKQIDEDDVVELGGVWLDPNLDNLKASNCMWLHMYQQVMKTKKKSIIFGYNTERKGLAKLYSKANPLILFSGEFKGKNIHTHRSLVIAYTNIAGYRKLIMREAFQRFLGFKKSRGISKLKKFNSPTSTKNVEAIS